MKEDFIQDFETFLADNGVAFKKLGNACLFIVHTGLLIVPVDLQTACVIDEDSRKAIVSACENELSPWKIKDVFFLYEDAFRSGGEQWRKRVLARCGKFVSVFARKCQVVRLRSQKEKEMARRFLDENHSLSWCTCKYCYALVQADGEVNDSEIVALASFSSALAVKRYSGRDLFVETAGVEGIHENSAVDAVPFESFQWLRYASVAGVRVVGGMGRLLKAFIRDLRSEFPGSGNKSCNLNGSIGNSSENSQMSNFCLGNIEIMSYSDNEWSCGKVYSQLGFNECGGRQAVEFSVDSHTWRRCRKPPQIKEECSPDEDCEWFTIRNCGSKRFLLQII